MFIQELANRYGISLAQAEQMAKDMDAEASAFWAYPGQEWQEQFQEQWVNTHCA